MDPSSILSDNFMDLLNTSMDVENVLMIQDPSILVTDLVKENIAIADKLSKLDELTRELIPSMSPIDIDKKYFQYLMPFLRNSLTALFEEVNQNVNNGSNKTIDTVRSCLMSSIKIHESFNCILTTLLQRNERTICISNVKQVVLIGSQILLATFQYCKESNTLYKDYFKELTEIVSLFKGAQSAHVNFLKLLEAQASFEFILEEQVLILTEVLEVLEEIGETLSNMNMKALTDSWKSYMILIQKHSNVLKQCNFKINKALVFLFSETAANLTMYKEWDHSDGIPTLKVSNFFIRVVVKLVEIFWANIDEIFVDAIESFALIYSLCPVVLKYNGCSDNLIMQVQTMVFDHCEILLDKLISQTNLLNVFLQIEPSSSNGRGCLFLLLYSLKYMSRKILSNNQLPYDCHLVINYLFKVIHYCYSEFFWNVTIPKNNESFGSIYDETVIYASIIICNCNQQQYFLIEKILLQNVLHSSSVWCSVISTNIWINVLSKKKSSLCLETLCKLISKCEEFLLNTFVDRFEIVCLEHLLRQLFKLLPRKCRLILLEKYPPCLYVHVWKIFHMTYLLQEESFSVESMIINLNERVNEFLQGRLTSNDFNFICNTFEMLSTLPTNYASYVMDLVGTLIKLWKMVHFRKDEDEMLKHFMRKLCQVTSNFWDKFSGSQVLHILTKIQEFLTFKDTKVSILLSLDSLLNVDFETFEEKLDIQTVLIQLFGLLFADGNVVIYQKTVEVSAAFLNSTKFHSQTMKNIIVNNSTVRNDVLNFIRKNLDATLVNSRTCEEYFEMQRNYNTDHICYISNTQETIKKCDEVVDVVIKRIKADIELLHKICDKNCSSNTNIPHIYNLLNKQFNINKF